jgi:hypothetical protein
MGAHLIYEIRFSVSLKSRKVLTVFMDPYKLPAKKEQKFPGGHRFSWIAFDPENENHRVLFDTHPPKGPHIHLDQEPDGKPFKWISVDHAQALFLEQIRQHFGEFEEEIKL